MLRGLRTVAAGIALAAAAAAAIAQDAPGGACPPQAEPPSPQALQEAAARARDHGLLWRLSKDGRSAWLYGTLHVGKLEWALPGPELRAALAVSDTIALELDVLDPQVRERLKPAADAAIPGLGAGLRERLVRQVDAACMPREAVAAQHPVMLAMTLSVLAARWEGLDPGFGQEFVLAGLARSGGKAVVSLETPELQMAALMPREPREAERMLVQTLEQLEDGSTRRAIARLARAWERGDLSDLADYERWCECAVSDEDRALLVRINDERNPGLAQRIDALHRDGRKVFAAVGALHMTGPKALPRLLEARGFRVERVNFR